MVVSKGVADPSMTEAKRRKQRENWDQFYSGSHPIAADAWLECHRHRFSSDMRILDLGCGNGANIPFLLSCSPSLYACDYSHSAIEQVLERFPVKARIADLRDPLPYHQGAFEIIVADLSIHYLTTIETMRLVGELHRVLIPEGVVLCRVNSSSEAGASSGDAEIIEPGLLLERKGGLRRYFDRSMIEAFFEPQFTITELKEYVTHKYHKPKHVWQMVLTSRK